MSVQQLPVIEVRELTIQQALYELGLVTLAQLLTELEQQAV